MHNKDDLYLSVKFYQQLADDTSGGIDRRVIEAGLIPKGLVSIRQCKGVEKYLLTPIALDGEYTVILFPCIHLNNH